MKRNQVKQKHHKVNKGKRQGYSVKTYQIKSTVIVTSWSCQCQWPCCHCKMISEFKGIKTILLTWCPDQGNPLAQVNRCYVDMMQPQSLIGLGTGSLPWLDSLYEYKQGEDPLPMLSDQGQRRPTHVCVSCQGYISRNHGWETLMYETHLEALF